MYSNKPIKLLSMHVGFQWFEKILKFFIMSIKLLQSKDYDQL